MTRNLYQRLDTIISATEPGGRLLSEPRLAEQLGVSRATLRETMRTFEMQGRIRRRQGVGTFVVHPTKVIESGLEVLESIETLAERAGLHVSMGKLRVTSCEADDNLAEQLKIEVSSKLVCVSRVILADDYPVAFLIDKLPDKFLSNDEVNGGFSGSVLDLLLRRGSPLLGSSRCEIKAIAAEVAVARALDIQRGDAVLCFDSLLFTIEGEPIDYSLSYFLPGYFKFHVVRRVG
ncbi:MAG: GntR family transcriptional regulator [Chloroflexota bacterium]|nr:GntR family transcriptional regulator [Chloroflexota bacterium]